MSERNNTNEKDGLDSGFSPFVCPTCFTSLKPDWSFCPTCGEPTARRAEGIPEPEEALLIREAEEFIYKQKFARALELLEVLIESSPCNARTLVAFVRVYSSDYTDLTSRRGELKAAVDSVIRCVPTEGRKLLPREYLDFEKKLLDLIEAEKREKAEQEAKEKAEREAKEKAEREANALARANNFANIEEAKEKAREDGFDIDDDGVLTDYHGNDSTVHIPFFVKEIGAYAFTDSKNVKFIYIPESVRMIRGSAFSGSSIVNVHIAEGPETIGGGAFSNSYSLSRISIPKTASCISSTAFSYCHSIVLIKVADGNPKYHVNKGCLIETLSRKLVTACRSAEIPNDGSVTQIDVAAFSGRVDGTFSIPSSVTKISDYAFARCEHLFSLKLSDGIRHIGKMAFYDCGLKELYFPDSMKIIESDAFKGCSNLTAVSLPRGCSYSVSSFPKRCVVTVRDQ